MEGSKAGRGRAGISRRGFLGLGAAAAAGSLLTLSGCGSKNLGDYQAKQAAEVPDWLGEAPEIAEKDIIAHESTALLIVGAGNAGMSAAATACDLGLDFIVADMNTMVQATREYVGAVNSRFSLAAGNEVDPNKLLNELSRYASFKCNQDVIKVWIRESAECVEWFDPMMAAAGKEVFFDMAHEEGTGGTDYYVPLLQHLWMTPYEPPLRNEIFEAHINDAGHEVRFKHKLVKLVQSAPGERVTGAIFETPEGYKQIDASAGVLLATGGYPSNPGMIRSRIPVVDRCVTASSFNFQNKGDGIRAGLWAGGVMDPDGAPMIFDRGAVEPGVNAGYMDQGPDAKFPGYVFQSNVGSQPFMKINRNGKRFCNESTPYDFICHAASYQPGGVWAQIFDANAADDIFRFGTIGCSTMTTVMLAEGWPLEEQLYYELGKGTLKVADTLEDLADQLQVPRDEFVKSVARYNELFEKGIDEDYGKEGYRLSAIKEPPFYGSWFGGTLLTTVDGLQINDNMQVLTEDGKVIEGLYSAGDCSGSVFSGNYPEYLVGCAVGRTVTFGRHVARLLAGDL